MGKGRRALFFYPGVLGGLEMSQGIYNRVTAKARLATMVGAVPLLAPHMKLYSNDFTPLPTSILGDFTEATFGGYTMQAPTFSAPVYDQNGIPAAPMGPVTFTCDGSSSGFAYGWYLIDSTGALVCAGRFDNAPLSFVSNGDAAVLFLMFGLTDAQLTVAQGP